jgi:hypothetical protein
MGKHIDPPVSIDTVFIAQITGIPKAREGPTILFNKAGERALSKEMKEKFQNFRGKVELDVKNISDDNVWFATQVLTRKLLRKCWKDEVLDVVIAVVEKCIEGVQMNWDTFLVNPFFQYCIEAWKKGTKFHYAWILKLIALVGW